MTSAGASIRQRTSRLAAATFATCAMLAAPVAHAGANPAASEAWASAAAAAATASPSASVSALAAAPVSATSTAPIAEAPVASPPPEAPAGDSSAVTAAAADGAAVTGHGIAVPPSNLVVTSPTADIAPPTTAEIPSAGLGGIAPSAVSAPEPSGAGATQSPPFTESGDIARYRDEQSGMPPPQYSGAMDYLRDGQMPTPIGIDLQEARRTLKSGEEADGLLIVAVRKGSPAAAAGLHAYNRTAKNVLTGAATVAMLFAPPAMLVLPVIDYMQFGESYDMVIGVDGSRVTNFLDFQDKTRDVQPGELIYLSVVRNGKRLQFVVPVPPNPSQPTN